MMVVFDYPTKKALKASVGKPLKVIGSPHVPEGEPIAGHNRPYLTGFNREFYAVVIVENGLIQEVK